MPYGDNEPHPAAPGAAVNPETEERELRIELMKTQIDHGRLDMKRIEQDLRTDGRKFLVQVLIASAALLGIGIALGRFIDFHS